jgi:hypothetical protein
MLASRYSLPVLVIALLGASACIDPMEAPSAYTTDTVALCKPENQQVYEQAVEDCQGAFANDRSCGGVLSFDGKIQGRPVTVSSRVQSSVAVLDQSSGAPLLDEVATNGSGPYFNFTTKFRSSGGRLETLGGQSRVLQYAGAPNAPSVPNPLEDDQVLFTLRLNGAESVTFTGTSGNLTFSEQTAQDVVGTFDTVFGSDEDHVTGCFHVFPQIQTAEAAPIQ